MIKTIRDMKKQWENDRQLDVKKIYRCRHGWLLLENNQCPQCKEIKGYEEEIQELKLEIKVLQNQLNYEHTK